MKFKSKKFQKSIMRPNFWQNIYLKKSFSVVGFLLIFFLAFTLINNFKVGASSALFYPNVCLGGWTNPQNASKEPEAIDFAEYTRNNSAVKEPNTSGQIFCGEFAGNIPSETEPVSLNLKLGLLVSFEELQIQNLDILENNQPIIIDSEENLVVESENIPKLDENKTEETSQPETEPQESNTDNQESILETVWNFLKPRQAIAQESYEPTENQIQILPDDQNAVTGNNITEETQERTIEEIQSEDSSLATESVENLDLEIIDTDTTEKEIINDESHSDLLEIYYTADSLSWHKVGVVNSENWEDVQFQIPIEEFPNWQDLSKLQISVQSLPVFELDQFLYLEHVELEIVYEKIDPLKYKKIIPEGDSGNVFRIVENGIISSEYNSYSANQNPQFNLNLPRAEELIKQEFSINQNANEQVNEIQESGPEQTEPQLIEEILTTEEELLPENTETEVEMPQNETLENPEPVNDQIPILNSSEEILSFITDFLKPQKAFADNQNVQISSIKIIDENQNKIDVNYTIDENNNIEITRNNPQSLIPGKYKIVIELQYQEKYFVIDKEFNWGVLNFNIEKNYFLPGEQIIIHLNHNLDNKIACDTNFDVTILDKKNTEEKSEIVFEKVKSPYCLNENETDLPHNFMTLVAPEKPSTYTVNFASQEIKAFVEFQIKEEIIEYRLQRSGQSSIIEKNEVNQMNMTLSTSIPLSGVLLEEIIPDITPIKDQSSEWEKVILDNGKTFISWPIQLEENQSISIGYDYIINKNQTDSKIVILNPVILLLEENLNEIILEDNAWILNIEPGKNKNIEPEIVEEDMPENIFQNETSFSIRNIFNIFNRSSKPTQSEIINPEIPENYREKDAENFTCILDPFSVNVKTGNTERILLLLDKSKNKNFEIEIGNSLPSIEIFFENKESKITTKSRQDLVEIFIKNNSQEIINATVPIIITDSDTKTYQICQLNIVTE